MPNFGGGGKIPEESCLNRKTDKKGEEKMKKEEFLTELEDVLQREEPCSENDILDDYDEWDSLAKMAVMAYYKKMFGIEIGLNDFNNIKSVSDLIKLAGDNIND